MALMLCTLSASAYDFIENGICYNILDAEKKTVETTYYPAKVNAGTETGYLYEMVDYTGSVQDCKRAMNLTKTDNHTYTPKLTYYYTGNVTIPSTVSHGEETYTVVKIGDYTFANCCELTSVSIPSSVREIGDYAFCASASNVKSRTATAYKPAADTFTITSKLSSITYQGASQLEVIGKYAFKTAKSLKVLEIPAGITTLDQDAVNNSSLSALYCAGVLPPSYTLSKLTNVYTVLFVPSSSVDSYRTCEPWSQYFTIEGYTPKQSSVSNAYNISFVDYNGTTISSELVKKGTSIDIPSDPEREGYTFIGWSPEVSTTAIADAVYTANYSKNIDYKHVTFNFNDPQSLGITTTGEETDLNNKKIVQGSISISLNNAYEINDNNYYLEIQRAGNLTITGNTTDIITRIEFDGNIAYFNEATGLSGNTWEGSANTVSFTVEDIRNVAAIINSINITYQSCTYTLTDGEEFQNEEEIHNQTITYTRNFKNTNWQALYVPFSINYDDVKNDFELAYLNDIHQFDDDNDGTIDRTALELIKLKSGMTTEPNTPYVIKAKSTGQKTITLDNATLYPTEEKEFNVTSWFTVFTFTGTYHTVSDMYTRKHYAYSAGKLSKATSDEAKLSPYRWYMDVIDRRTGDQIYLAKAISIIFDDGEVTSISPILNNEVSSEVDEFFTIGGQKINNIKSAPKNSIIINKGKKIFIKK